MKVVYQCQICQQEFQDELSCKNHEEKCEKQFYLKFLFSKDHNGTLENSVIEYIRKIQGDNEFNIDLINYINLKRYIELVQERFPNECPANCN